MSATGRTRQPLLQLTRKRDRKAAIRTVRVPSLVPSKTVVRSFEYPTPTTILTSSTEPSSSLPSHSRIVTSSTSFPLQTSYFPTSFGLSRSYSTHQQQTQPTNTSAMASATTFFDFKPLDSTSFIYLIHSLCHDLLFRNPAIHWPSRPFRPWQWVVQCNAIHLQNKIISCKIK